MEPSRQILWNIGSRTLLHTWSVVVSLSWMGAIALRVLCPSRSLPSLGCRVPLRAVLRTVFTLRGIHLGHIPLRMHRLIFYGFLLLLLATGLVAMQDHLALPILRGGLYLGFELGVDLAGIALLVGLAMAAHKRYIKRAERLVSRPWDALILALLVLVVLSAYLLKGLRLLALRDPWQLWSPVGFGVAKVCGWVLTPGQGRVLHAWVWGGHLALAMLFLALAPWTKLAHVLALPLHLRWRRSPERMNHLETPRGDLASGTSRFRDLPPEARLEVDACMQCGRCRKQCPMQQAKAPASPESLFQSLKGLLHTGAWTRPLLGSALSEEALWSCTACRACEERCPMGGDLVERVVGIRRGAVGEGRLPQAVAERFSRVASVAQGLRPQDPDLLYLWPGCQAGQGKGAATLDALVSLLGLAGLRVVVLEPPRCCGGTDRLLGNEALFQEVLAANLDYLRPLEGARVLSACPHCLNTLRREYPLALRLQHHTELLLELQSQGRLPSLGTGGGKVSYHDACFLGRYQGDYETPRQLLAGLGVALVEMSQARKKAPCCGSGGGAVLTEAAHRNARRRLRQAESTGAERLLTACPHCRASLEAVGGMVVEDIVDLLHREYQL